MPNTEATKQRHLRRAIIPYFHAKTAVTMLAIMPVSRAFALLMEDLRAGANIDWGAVEFLVLLGCFSWAINKMWGWK